MRKLYHFHGGIHPPGNKTQSTQVAIAQAPLPSRLVVPLHQHAGEAAKPIVQVGDHVLKGQLIGMPDGVVSSAVHAPTSGIITAIDMQLIAHPSGLPNLCATLIPDGKEEWVARQPINYRDYSAAELQQLLRMAGVVGLGGAAFPSDMKLYLNQYKITTLILNGAECEPYISCDDMLMRECSAGIVAGAEMLRFMLDANEVLIGIEDNKPEALAAMRAAAGQHAYMEVIAVPTLYPGGGAKQLIRVLTGIEVAAGVRSTDKGVQCFNVATAWSVHRALAHGEPLLSRIVTITGNVRQAQNFETLLGTPIDELVALSGALPDTNGYIMGGTMMGITCSACAGGQGHQLRYCFLGKIISATAARDAVHTMHALCGCVPGRFAAAGFVLVCAIQRIRQSAGLQPVRLHRMRCVQLCLPQPYSAGTVLPFCQE
jgi:electron transport complex protein RnfC